MPKDPKDSQEPKETSKKSAADPADQSKKSAADPADSGNKPAVEVLDAEVVDEDELEASSEREGADSDDEDGPSDDELADDVDVIDVGEPVVRTRAKKGKKATSESTAVARRDPLAMYMKDVQRYPLLTREQEHELAVRYVEHGDLEAARKLILSNLRLVVKIAYDYRQAYKNLLDLVQEGNMGLMQAVKKYDPYKGVKLSSYAAWWIRAYILRYILNNFRLVKLGTTQAQRKLFFNLQKEKSRLSAMGIEPSAEKIADRLGVPVKDVESMDRRLSAGEASLDAPVGQSDGKSTSRIELMSAGGPRVDDVLAAEELDERMRDKIREYGALLKGKEKRIFEERLLAEEPKTLQQLGDEFGVSRERVRQVEKRLLEKMKKYLEDQLGRAVLDVYEAP